MRQAAVFVDGEYDANCVPMRLVKNMNKFNMMAFHQMRFERHRGLLLELLHKLCAPHKQCASRKFCMRNSPATLWCASLNRLIH